MPENETSSEAPTGATIRIKLVRSVIGCNERQRATVKSLGLRKLHQVVTQADTEVARGMIFQVKHLVQVLEN